MLKFETSSKSGTLSFCKFEPQDSKLAELSEVIHITCNTRAEGLWGCISETLCARVKSGSRFEINCMQQLLHHPELLPASIKTNFRLVKLV